MKKMNVALLILAAIGAGIGTAATLVDRIGFNISPPANTAALDDSAAR